MSSMVVLRAASAASTVGYGWTSMPMSRANAIADASNAVGSSAAPRSPARARTCSTRPASRTARASGTAPAGATSTTATDSGGTPVRSYTYRRNSRLSGTGVTNTSPGRSSHAFRGACWAHVVRI
ncbi:hypothetical protein OG753_35180 [Streptomyces sp. NBC_00029]